MPRDHRPLIKKVGDNVDRDEPPFEISTDKVDAGSVPGAGVLTEIKGKETVPVNSTLSRAGGEKLRIFA